jgi:hypothetical protein
MAPAPFVKRAVRGDAVRFTQRRKDAKMRFFFGAKRLSAHEWRLRRRSDRLFAPLRLCVKQRGVYASYGAEDWTP